MIAGGGAEAAVMLRSRLALSLALVFSCSALPAWAAPPFDPAAALRNVLHWRAIGPARGGRTIAISGVPGRPHEFYIAAVNGGIFKTTDSGRIWTPIFDDQPTASIGALAVAPSAPDTIYAGSGEGRQRPDLAVGDGIYKSTDAGVHWTHLGLRDGQQIPKIVVDPRDPNRLYVAVLGHPYGPNTERGIYRSTDGGATFERVLYVDENSGAFDLTLDPSDARTLYATLWAARQPPWETTDGGSFGGKGTSGLYKSTDGGSTWKRLDTGLPGAIQGLSRMAVAVAPSDAKRVYAFATANDKAGVYRSDDAGATWAFVNGTDRITERGEDLVTLAVDPRDRDTVYETNTTTYKSTDAGKTFVPLRGAPGGDDYQSIWIAPDDPRTILLGSDQGAVISLNGGATWSSWYNQPTAQFYHVITDDRFPYRVYGGQQESGSAGVLSRGNDGAITFRDWHPVGVEEYGYVAPDRLHPGIIYGGKVSRYDERTGQQRDVGPVLSWRGNPQYRFRRTAPLGFSPADPHALYLGGNVVFASTDYGAHWRVISPDLTRPNPQTPPNAGVFADTAYAKRPHRGVVYALGLSPRDRNVLWAGTDDGLVWHTADGGKHWRDVTPPGVGAWAKISIIDASPFDTASAYVAVNRFRLDEQRPQLFRTHDGGKTWTEIDRGIEAAPTNVVRADPQRRGLLYAGTERGVWMSFDDGGTWSSLRLNLPATSVRDLVVHGDDLVIGTHGRGFWVLDDIAPLRQADALAPRATRAVEAGARLARAAQHEHRHAAAAGRASLREPAARSRARLRAAARSVARSPHDRRSVRPGRAPLRERRRAAARRPECTRRARLVDCAAGSPRRERGRAPLHLEPAGRTAAHVRLRADDRGDPARYAARTRRPDDTARHVRRHARRRRREANARARSAPRSARARRRRRARHAICGRNAHRDAHQRGLRCRRTRTLTRSQVSRAARTHQRPPGPDARLG